MILSSEVARLFGLTAAPEVGVQGLGFQSLHEAKRFWGCRIRCRSFVATRL